MYINDVTNGTKLRDEHYPIVTSHTIAARDTA